MTAHDLCKNKVYHIPNNLYLLSPLEVSYFGSDNVSGMVNKIILTVLAISVATVMQAQADLSAYQLVEAKVSITGESTLHDWTVEAKEILDMTEVLHLVADGSGQVDSFGFRVSVEAMDGGRGAAMNDKIHKALHSKLHPYVSYQQEGPAHYVLIDNQLTLVSNGLLSMAGFVKDESIKTTGVIVDSMLTLTATHPLAMSEYDIEPPSAMFGQIQTKDNVSITIEMVYEVQ